MLKSYLEKRRLKSEIKKLSTEEKELLIWLLRNLNFDRNYSNVMNFLRMQGESPYPDKCYKIYSNLNIYQRVNIESLFSELSYKPSSEVYEFISF